MLIIYAIAIATLISAPSSAWSAGYGDPCSSGNECPISPGRNRGYCYPGPEGGNYCLNGNLNCAKPGSEGVEYGHSYISGGREYKCVSGVGWDSNPTTAAHDDNKVQSARRCSYDCHDRCGVKIGFVRFVEPACHVKCEAEKKVCEATGIHVPNVPLTPVEISKTAGTQTCISLYQAITKTLMARCSNWDGRTTDRDIIQRAKQLVISTGLIRSSEFDPVDIRWCPLPSGTAGITPDRNVIYLNQSLKFDPLPVVAATLAHEMTHVRQYGRMGTDDFKCAYSRKFAECGGCQDRRHPLEQEAYDFESRARSVLNVR
jgi:hypothetical protein